MIFLKSKHEGIFQAQSNDKSILYGYYGQIKTLVPDDILLEIDPCIDKEIWLFVSVVKEANKGYTYNTKEELENDLIKLFK